MPVRLSLGEPGNGRGSSVTAVIYSDDHGRTGRVGEIIGLDVAHGQLQAFLKRILVIFALQVLQVLQDFNDRLEFRREFDLGRGEIRIAVTAEARFHMLTTFEGDVEIQRALEAGARGYLLKSMPPKELVEVIRQVHAGKKRIPPELAAQLAEHLGDEPLTPREIEVLRHITGGNRNLDIAERLLIMEETVKVHVKHIMEKLMILICSDAAKSLFLRVRRNQ